MTANRTAPALVMFATLAGLAIRLAPALAADFPLNDGGLFYAMTSGLRAENYALPVFVQYNGAAIPFAYPPLGFYFTGLITDLLRADLLDVMRWLPPLVSALSIPAFYLLARRLSPSKTTAALAAVIFALTPRAFAWLIMGGGVTRAPGFLFAILTLACAHRLFTAPSHRLILWTSIWAALTVLTHPEAAAQTAFAALLLFLFFGRNRAGVIHALLVAGLTIVLTAPWWGVMLARHGFAPFLAASAAVRADGVSWLARLLLLFRFEVTSEPFLPLIAVLGLVGVFIQLARRERFLPAWLGLAFLFEPRSAPQTMTIPLAILTACALMEIVVPALLRASTKTIASVALGLLATYLFLSAQATTNHIANNISLTLYDREAMQWAKTNTPEDSVFLILTGQLPLRDAVSEWFPALTDRISAMTVFGHEWTAEPPFSSRLHAYDTLQACIFQDSQCLQIWSQTNRISFSHILISSSETGKKTPLQVYLDSGNNFTLIYSNETVSIYQKK